MNETAETWAERGFDALRDGDPEAALSAAEELFELRNTAGFEIAALAHLQAGRPEEAVRLLEEGVVLGPGVWILWQLLGNARSDLGRVDEAREAYRRAAECEGADLASIELNRAILLMREGRAGDALALLRAREGGEHAERFATAEAEALLALGRAAEARACLEQQLAQEPEDRATLFAFLAEAWIALEDPGEARRAALAALAEERGHAHALWCLRELGGPCTDVLRGFRLVVRGTLTQAEPEGAREYGFYTTYQVVAADADDAFARASALEPEAVRPALLLEEVEEIDVEPDLPAGVYHMGGYALYDADSDGALDPGDPR